MSALFSTTPVEGWGAFCAEPAKLTWVMWVVQIPAFPRVDSVTTNTVSIMLYANTLNFQRKVISWILDENVLQKKQYSQIIQVRKPNASNACTSRHRVSTGETELGSSVGRQEESKQTKRGWQRTEPEVAIRVPKNVSSRASNSNPHYPEEPCMRENNFIRKQNFSAEGYSQVQPNSAATMEGIAPLRLRERKSLQKEIILGQQN